MNTYTHTTHRAPSIRVAIADDQLMVRSSIAYHLETDGDISVVIQASNGQELLDELQRAASLPDVCLLDILMPVRNGIQTMSCIRHQWPEIRAMALTGYLNEAYTIQMILAGANGYLTKNTAPDQLRKAVRVVHEYGVYYNQQFTPAKVKAATSNELLPQFTAMELELLRNCIQDLTYQEIADRMGCSAKSVEGYRNRLFHKIGVRTRSGLILFAISNGYVPIDLSPLPNS
jgi:two-component system invasion response regulator UvrY